MSSNEQQMSEERILERVRKMLAIANCEAATEGERENALRMAHNLLMKHGLAMADVSEHERDKVDPRGKYANEGWSMIWAKQIRQTVARLFMCSYYYGGKINATRCKHNFVGRESNATTAMYMADWIIDSVLREARSMYKHNLAPESRAFAIGVSNALYARVGKMLETAEVESVPGSAVVLRNMALEEAEANEAFIAEHCGTLTVGRSARSVGNSNAYAAGVSFGNKVNLNKQVATGTKQTLKLK